jgi:hypothetical protein
LLLQIGFVARFWLSRDAHSANEFVQEHWQKEQFTRLPASERSDDSGSLRILTGELRRSQAKKYFENATISTSLQYITMVGLLPLGVRINE